MRILLITFLLAFNVTFSVTQPVDAHAGYHYQWRCVMGYVQQRHLIGTENHYWTYISNWYTLDGMRCGW
jgi:hypothetical protein